MVFLLVSVTLSVLAFRRIVGEKGLRHGDTNLGLVIREFVPEMILLVYNTQNRFLCGC